MAVNEQGQPLITLDIIGQIDPLAVLKSRETIVYSKPAIDEAVIAFRKRNRSVHFERITVVRA